MKRKDLIDNIEGSRLKKQYLEAFLLQSTFIEGLLKRLMEQDIFTNITFPILRAQSGETEYSFDSLHSKFIKEKLLRQNLYDLIETLKKLNVITPILAQKLHTYRELRNRVMHDLVGNMSRNQFEAEIETMVVTGQEILNETAMIRASESLQAHEELIEAVESGNRNKVDEYIRVIESALKK